jgi:hypothetical protein
MSKLLTEENIESILKSVHFILNVNTEEKYVNYLCDFEVQRIIGGKPNLNEIVKISNVVMNNIVKHMDKEKDELIKELNEDSNSDDFFMFQTKFVQRFNDKLDVIKRDIMKDIGISKNTNPIDFLSKKKI